MGCDWDLWKSRSDRGDYLTVPVTTIKTKGGFMNRTPGGIKGQGMTKKNAVAQKRLLNAVDHGWKPSQKKGRLIER
jgi:hypothetical protein